MSDEQIEESGVPEGFLGVEATGAGGSPVNAAGRSWNKGDKGLMDEVEAIVRIEHGHFKATDQAALEAAVERRRQAVIAAAEVAEDGEE